MPAHILVVDDDQAIREMLTEYLGQNELRVTAVPDGKGLLATLSGSVVDLVVLDLKLAGEDGLMLARRLHEQFSIPVVIVSGRTDTADRVMGLELGADDYVTKPLSLRELLARIHVVLRRRRPKARAMRVPQDCARSASTAGGSTSTPGGSHPATAESLQSARRSSTCSWRCCRRGNGCSAASSCSSSPACTVTTSTTELWTSR
jgi:DNA-binding response OmpR family regulator